MGTPPKVIMAAKAGVQFVGVDTVIHRRRSFSSFRSLPDLEITGCADGRAVRTPDFC